MYVFPNAPAHVDLSMPPCHAIAPVARAGRNFRCQQCMKEWQRADVCGMVQETATTLIGMVVGMAVLRMASGMSRIALEMMSDA